MQRREESRMRVLAVVAIVLFGCAVMTWIDGVLRPPYAVKSAVKVLLFLALPLGCARIDGSFSWKTLFSAPRGAILRAAALGAAVFFTILLAAFLLRGVLDLGAIESLLGENAGVTGENFLFVALYISLCNSLLEEFFFRGFAFFLLRDSAGRGFAYAFSALSFAFYHTAMMLGWFSLPLFLLALFGLAAGGGIFNWLDEHSGSIFPSWAVHICANLAINSVGVVMFGLV